MIAAPKDDKIEYWNLFKRFLENPEKYREYIDNVLNQVCEFERTNNLYDIKSDFEMVIWISTYYTGFISEYDQLLTAMNLHHPFGDLIN